MQMLIRFFMILLLTSSCKDTHEKNSVLLSPMFGVCASFDDNSKYFLNKSKPVDWDDGKLILDGQSIQMYIGLHPHFPKREIESNSGDIFKLVGQVYAAGDSKLLYSKTANGNPLYIMFEGDEQSLKYITRKNYHFFSCTSST